MAGKTDYREITSREREIMEANGCQCDDWGRIHAAPGFRPGFFRNVAFSGDVYLGVMDGSRTLKSGMVLSEGIYDARIHNCTVGDHVAIHRVNGYIANYIIEDNVTITDCGRIVNEGSGTFGNGIAVNVLNETGGRHVRMWDRLSAQLGYVIALYRHRSKTISAVDSLIDSWCDTVRSDFGTIGDGSVVTGCGIIRNVRTGPAASIENSLKLEEGSINSCREAPVYIGPGVIMEKFIVCSGSVVTESTIVNRCFIGQGCHLGKHYSAENSLFFANCGGYHGEACSIFAGPFTVTHHKSTLLIAGIYSFMNAGSGSNQSNHMYKLGPIHQGIMERGSKTTSDSYLLWPARIGPFTLVMGRHYKNMDTSMLPFSYLIEHNDESILVPGINLRSVGTIRDARKWPMRDIRKDPVLIDQINYNLLSPYTIRKMIQGRDLLRNLRENSGPKSEYYTYDSMKINRQSLERGIELYQTGINKFLGNSLIKRLEGVKLNSVDGLRKRLRPDLDAGRGEWTDIAGLIAPQNEVEALLDRIDEGVVGSLDEINAGFAALHSAYYDMEWSWAAARIEEEEGRDLKEFTPGDVVNIVEKWRKSVVGLDYKLYEDAMKEFTLSSRTGFGIDGAEEVKRADFEAVRGDFESNPVVSSIMDHIKVKSALGDELTARMKKLI
ncbi:MAG: DUF4954 family protein [Bacteroidetes bacterium]|nr:DUF4954 family protein [Bacteroidota bacterium]